MPDTPAPPDTQDHVRASARFLGLPLDEHRVARVAVHLERTRQMVRALQELPLDAEEEPTDVFKPAPFPPGSGS